MLNFQTKNELYFGEVLEYDKEVLKVRAGNVKRAVLPLLPKDLKGATHLWPSDKIAFWRGKDGGFEARLLKRSEYENLLKKLNVTDHACNCCYHAAQRKLG